MLSELRAPPRFDIYGRQIPSASPVPIDPTFKMPLGWSLNPSEKTQTGLLEERRLERIPHPSYDLDKDGKVGGADLIISKLFDKDKDGMLNEGERKEAEKALSQGVLDKFVWGVEGSGPTRAYRIIQKRGVIVDQEDFADLKKTYPEMRLPKPAAASLTELRHKRAQARLRSLQTQRETWDRLHPIVVEMEQKEYAQTSHFPYRSLSEKVDLEAKSNRLKGGLSAETTEVSAKKPPSLDYVQKPQFPTKSSLDSERRAEMLHDLYAKKNFEHVNGEQRLLERESRLVTIAPEGHKSKTYSDVKEQIRQETNRSNMEKFSNVVIGIHGQEIPKFEEHLPEYYRAKPGFVEQPHIASSIELHQSRKFWAPADPYKTTDKDEAMPPPDPFKSVHVRSQEKEAKLPDKPTQHLPAPYVSIDPSEIASRPRKLKFRWTTLVHYFAKGSVFAPLKDPEIEQVDEISVEEKKEMKQNTTVGSSEAPAATQGNSSLSLKRGFRFSGNASKRLTKANSTSLIRSSGFTEPSQPM